MELPLKLMIFDWRIADCFAIRGKAAPTMSYRGHTWTRCDSVQSVLVYVHNFDQESRGKCGNDLVYIERNRYLHLDDDSIGGGVLQPGMPARSKGHGPTGWSNESSAQLAMVQMMEITAGTANCKIYANFLLNFHLQMQKWRRNPLKNDDFRLKDGRFCCNSRYGGPLWVSLLRCGRFAINDNFWIKWWILYKQWWILY